MKALLKKTVQVSILLLITACMVRSCVYLFFAEKLTPNINLVKREGDKIIYSDTMRLCRPNRINRNNNCYTVILTEPVDKIEAKHRCNYCGAAWGRHKTSYEWTLEEWVYP